MAKIVIDPGHYGGYNQGVCPGYYEGNTMLVLSKYLGDELSKMGADILYTRTTNEQNPSLAQRGGMAAGADLFISMHSDASENIGARGVTVYNSVQRPNGELLATDVGKAAAEAMGTPFRETIARESESNPGYDYLGVLRAAVATGVPNAFLVEHGFHSNVEDCAILSEEDALRRVANAEARVIGEYFSLNVPTVTRCCFYYIVQPGEYLYIIGKKFGIPWQMIAEVNNIREPYLLSSGQKIIIPMPAVPC